MKATFNSTLVITTVANEATGEDQPLFFFDVQVCKASSDREVRFSSAAPSGGEVEQVYREVETGEILERGDLIKGVRSGGGFAEVDAEQIEAIDSQTKLPDIRVERSAPLDEVPFERATSMYYLQAPAKGGSLKAYRLTYEALRAAKKKGKVPARPARALQVKFTSRSRQKTGVVYADEQRQCLVLVTLCFAGALRQPDEQVLAPQGVEVEAKQVEMAATVIAGLGNVEGVTFDTPEDELLTKRRELVDAAAAGEVIAAAPTPEAKTVEADKLGAALAESLAAVA